MQFLCTVNCINSLIKLIFLISSNPILFICSLVHSLLDERMNQSAESVYLLEKSTENSWQFIVQLTALASGAIKEDDYIFEIEFVTGKEIKIPTCKINGINCYRTIERKFFSLVFINVALIDLFPHYRLRNLDIMLMVISADMSNIAPKQKHSSQPCRERGDYSKHKKGKTRGG